MLGFVLLVHLGKAVEAFGLWSVLNANGLIQSNQSFTVLDSQLLWEYQVIRAETLFYLLITVDVNQTSVAPDFVFKTTLFSNHLYFYLFFYNYNGNVFSGTIYSRNVLNRCSLFRTLERHGNHTTLRISPSWQSSRAIRLWIVLNANGLKSKIQSLTVLEFQYYGITSSFGLKQSFSTKL